jgi:hypothetical protein
MPPMLTPEQMAAAGMLPPLGPPPPTPASAGFAAYIADPQNAQTIANSLIKPNTPIQSPAAPQAYAQSQQQPTQSPQEVPVLPANVAAPDAPRWSPVTSAPSTDVPAPVMNGGIPQIAPEAPQQVVNQDATPQSWAAAHPDQAAQPQWKHQSGSGWRGALKDIGGIVTAAALGGAGAAKGDPGAGVRWVGQQQDYDRSVPDINQQRWRAAVVQPQIDAADAEGRRALATQRTATANKTDALTDDLTPFVVSKEQANAVNNPSLAGTRTTMRDYSRLVGQAGNNRTSVTNNAANNTAKVTVAETAAEARKKVAESTNKTRELIAAHHDATSAGNNTARINAKGSGGSGNAPGGGFKVPADITKRASLASNVNENVDAATEIIDRNPAIVGAVGGRYSNVQQMIGSDDPDINALGVRMHNIALASNGAHGVRSQQAIQKTEDDLFNHFKTGVNGMKGSFGATKASMQTFLDDEKNFATTGGRRDYSAPSGGGNVAPEGTVIKMADGSTQIKRGGKWVPNAQ